MVAYYYDNQLGNTSSSDGLNDFLLSGSLSNFNSLTTLLNKYVPYYIQSDSLAEWEYGLGYVYNNGAQDVLIRGGNLSYPFSTIYSSSNNNNKVNFSAGTKTIKAVISAERINHGGNNFASITNTNFSADTVQTIYGILASGVSVTGQLPSASGNKNLLLGFRLLEGSNNNVIITGVAGQNIDGVSTITLTPAEKYTAIISDGSGWYALNRSVNVESAGLPSGTIGSVQFKESATEFKGVDELFWDRTNKNLYIGGTTTGSASTIIPATSGQNIIFNNQAYNNDFQVKGTGTTNQLFFDASTGRLGINTNSPSTILHIIGRCANDTMRLESSTACATGVALTLYHSPSTGSDIGDYPATINLAGRNSNAQQTNFAQIRSKVLGTGINATSGEFVVSVDYLGVPTTTLTTNPKKITIGLSGNASNTDNILIGNFIDISGSNSIALGHNSAISGASSSGNIVLGHNTDVIGQNNAITSHNSYISGNNIYIAGPTNNISGSYIIGFASNTNVSGNYNTINGFNNNFSGNYNAIFGYNNTLSLVNSGLIYGNNNTITTNTSGFIIGSNNIINGTGINAIGLVNSVSGTNNTVLGRLDSVVGSGNYALGNNNSVNATGNLIVGNNIAATGLNNIVIGSNLNNTNNNNIVMGIDSNQIVIGTNGIILNSGLVSSDTVIYGSSANSGVFIRDNRVGINTIPTGATLQVSGSISGISAHVDALRVGSVSTSGYILKTDASGNASWAALSSIQGNLTEGLATDGFVVYNGSQLISSTGIYWNSTSGVLYTNNSNHILPTGNGTFIINNNQQPLSNVFNIKGSGNNNLLVVNAATNRVGINTTPSYNLHVSGTLRSSTDSYYFIENNANEFIVAYDVGPSTLNRIKITSSGTFIRNNSATPILPEHTSFSSTTSLSTASGLCNVVYDTSTEQLLYRNNIIAGFGTFTGSADT